MTSYGPRTLHEGPETRTEWESETRRDGRTNQRGEVLGMLTHLKSDNDMFKLKSSDLGMFTRLFVMLSTTLPVRLKIESLSGFTDLVVSMTNMSGGFST